MSFMLKCYHSPAGRIVSLVASLNREFNAQGNPSSSSSQVLATCKDLSIQVFGHPDCWVGQL